MTSVVKNVLFALGGFLTGLGIGVAATKAAIEPRINKAVKKGIEEYIGAKTPAKEPENPLPPVEPIIMKRAKVTVVDPRPKTSVLTEDKKDQQKAVEMTKGTYNTFEESEAPDDIDFKNGPAPLLVGPFRAGTVRIISEELFDESPDYTKSSLAYYTVDCQFFDETDEPLKDDQTYGLVGSNILNCFGIMSSDPDIVYVRNENRNLNIEVARIRGRHDDET